MAAPKSSDDSQKEQTDHEVSLPQDLGAQHDRKTSSNHLKKSPATTTSHHVRNPSFASEYDHIDGASGQTAQAGNANESADCKLLAEDDDHGSPSKPSSKTLHREGKSAKLSGTESFACILAPLAMITIIVTLYHFRNRPLQQWPLAISVNTVLAI